MNDYNPVIGKTYSLFGNCRETQAYYNKIRELTNNILDIYQFDQKSLLAYLIKIDRNRISLRKAKSLSSKENKLSNILELLHKTLADYSPGVEQHLKTEPVYKCITDYSILSTREQYYLFMIEIELTNRLNKLKFLNCNYKIALLPYCLRKKLDECKSVADEIDYYCIHCSKNCYISKISTILKKHDIHPYIWMSSRLKSLIRNLVEKYGSIGVMGIACIVELANGMKSCRKAGIPVVGIPLNANRCIRWMGDFYENSVDMEDLKLLIT
jgi:hypothetical protein